MSSTTKLQLPAFLKALTSGGLAMPKAMAIASKIYKTHNTVEHLSQLTDSELVRLGVDNKDDRKQLLAAVRKSSGTCKRASSTTKPSPASTSGLKAKDSPRKRKRDDDLNDMLPISPRSEGQQYGSLEFNEVLDEEVLRTKSAVVNRAPVMTAWATVVAEKLGFAREEALSIAAAYTEMNAISKGVSIGVFDQSKGKGVELSKGEAQPYVDLMGRRIALYEAQSSQWRALVKGSPIDPVTGYSYMARSFRQTLPYIIGAMRLLANSYSAQHLNQHGFGMYADFRPEVNGWGKRAEVRCDKILSLRKSGPGQCGVDGPEGSVPGDSNTEARDKDMPPIETGRREDDVTPGAPAMKKTKSMTVEEYEVSLDDSLFTDPALDEYL